MTYFRDEKNDEVCDKVVIYQKEIAQLKSDPRYSLRAEYPTFVFLLSVPSEDTPDDVVVQEEKGPVTISNATFGETPEGIPFCLAYLSDATIKFLEQDSVLFKLGNSIELASTYPGIFKDVRLYLLPSVVDKQEERQMLADMGFYG